MRDPGSDPHAMHHQSQYDEVLPDIKSLLIADANVGSMVLKQAELLHPAPSRSWANMFTYYVPDPFNDSTWVTSLSPS